MEQDTDDKEMEDVKLDDERESHWRTVSEDNYGGVDDNKPLLNDNRWDVYVKETENPIKSGYLVEVVGLDFGRGLFGEW